MSSHHVRLMYVSYPSISFSTWNKMKVDMNTILDAFGENIDGTDATKTTIL